MKSASCIWDSGQALYKKQKKRGCDKNMGFWHDKIIYKQKVFDKNINKQNWILI